MLCTKSRFICNGECFKQIIETHLFKQPLQKNFQQNKYQSRYTFFCSSYASATYCQYIVIVIHGIPKISPWHMVIDNIKSSYRSKWWTKRMISHWLSIYYVYQLLPDNLSWSAGQSPLKSVSFVHGYTPPSNKTYCPNKDFIQGSQLSKRATMSNAASPSTNICLKTMLQ